MRRNTAAQIDSRYPPSFKEAEATRARSEQHRACSKSSSEPVAASGSWAPTHHGGSDQASLVSTLVQPTQALLRSSLYLMAAPASSLFVTPSPTVLLLQLLYPGRTRPHSKNQACPNVGQQLGRQLNSLEGTHWPRHSSICTNDSLPTPTSTTAAARPAKVLG